MSIHFYPLRVQDIQRDIAEAVVVTFEVPEDLKTLFHFTQGQYLTLRREIAGADIRRSYSICSATEEALRVGIRRVPDGVFSNWICNNLKTGDTLQVIPPQGRFFVPIDEQIQRHYLGLAGGSGITPILSIMKTVLQKEPLSRFTLVYGNRTQRSTMFKEELEDLKDRYLTRLVLHYVFSDEYTEVSLHHGLLNRDKITELLATIIPANHFDHAFVCGPYQMNDEAEMALKAQGLKDDQIHIERFGIPQTLNKTSQTQVLPGDAKQASIVIIRDGTHREIPFSQSDHNLLNAASAAGLEVPYSCQSGVCCTCRAKLLEGKVRMERNFALDKDEVDAGFILACQAHPLTERIVISFDER